MNRPYHSQGPVSESNKHLARFVSRIPDPPVKKAKDARVLWHVAGFSAAVVAGVAWAAFWTWGR